MQDERKSDDADYEAALEDALGNEPHAAELRRMQLLLIDRRRRLMADLESSEDDREKARLKRQLAELDTQIEVVGEEAQITKFVEDAVRVGIEMRRFESS